MRENESRYIAKPEKGLAEVFVGLGIFLVLMGLY